MSEVEKVMMDTPPQELAEPIWEGDFRNLSAAQIERISNVWKKVERHASMSLDELLALFDSRPGSIDRDISALVDVFFVLGPDFDESSRSSEENALVVNFLLDKLRGKLDPTFRGDEEKPPTPSLDEYFEIVYSHNSYKAGHAVAG